MANDPNAVIAVARTMAAAGAPWEAEVTLHAALARTPDEHSYRSALMTLRTEEGASRLTLDFPLAMRWIRDGMLVEALALLVAFEMGEEASQWADVLGELLAPVPTQAPDPLHQMHRALLTGSAPLAMTLLEDAAKSDAALPAWAQRRLDLLRWVLLDNAGLATDDVGDTTHSELSRALTPGLEARSLDAMAEAAGALAARGDSDASLTQDALRRLCAEVKRQAMPDNPSNNTLPISGRTAAAMQLLMTNFAVAKTMYDELARESADAQEAQSLLEDVGGVERVLRGKPFTYRRFAPAPESTARRPSTETARFDDSTAVRAAIHSATFDDATAVRHVKDVELAATFDDATTAGHYEPSGIRSGTFEGLGFDDPTRVAVSNELPLAAFDEDITRTVDLPDAKPYPVPASRSFEDVTARDTPDAPVASDARVALDAPVASDARVAPDAPVAPDALVAPKRAAAFQAARVEPAGSAHGPSAAPPQAAPRSPVSSPLVSPVVSTTPASAPDAAGPVTAPLAREDVAVEDLAVRVMPIVPVGNQ